MVNQNVNKILFALTMETGKNRKLLSKLSKKVIPTKERRVRLRTKDKMGNERGNDQ